MPAASLKDFKRMDEPRRVQYINSAAMATTLRSWVIDVASSGMDLANKPVRLIKKIPKYKLKSPVFCGFIIKSLNTAT